MNQNSELEARDQIDQQLTACGWIIQNKNSINLAAGTDIAIREYQTGAGPADYILFVYKKPVGLIEAKREEEGVRLFMHDQQWMAFAYQSLSVNQSSIKGRKSKTYHLLLPPFGEQQIVQEIESRLSVRDKIEETITASLKQAEALRQSILKKAFEGKLRIANDLVTN